MDNPETEIAQLLARQQVKVRKPEKSTQPNLFYIDADDVSLIPSATEKEDDYLWSSQSMGVGHFAKEAEKLAYSNNDVVEALMKVNGQQTTAGEVAKNGSQKSIDVMLGKGRRAYDVADKGILWGWEVSAYVWTKAIATGVFLVAMIGFFAGWGVTEHWAINEAVVIGTTFLAITGALLVMDLDRPDRFLYVLLRPHWGSWLVKGGYSIGIYGTLLAVLGGMAYFQIGSGTIVFALLGLTTIFAVITSIYTAFLFSQAKGRDFWQSPILAIHMLVHSVMAGAAVYTLTNLFIVTDGGWEVFLKYILMAGIAINLFTMFIELYTTHPTDDAKRTVQSIVNGRYKTLFWGGVIAFGNVLPLVLLLVGGSHSVLLAATGVIVLIGIYLVNHIWVEAPQRIPLS
jgi:formate-dependent nitrite reductase membrane component NrfD